MTNVQNIFNRNNETDNQEEKKMKKEEKKAAREAKKNQKKLDAEVKKQEREEAEEQRMQAVHQSQTETEALFRLMGQKQFTFFKWALIMLVVCAGLYFFIQSAILCLAIFLSVLSWLGVTN